MTSRTCVVVDPTATPSTSTSTSSTSSTSTPTFEEVPFHEPPLHAHSPRAAASVSSTLAPPEVEFTLKEAVPATKISFQGCVHGGKKDKWTSFVCSLPGLESLAAKCPGESESHKHAPWDCRFQTGRWRFATAEEAEYPLELCRALSRSLIGIIPTSATTSRRAFVEICCGCARASRVMRDAGCEVYSIDHAGNEHKPEVEQLTIDVVTTEGIKQIWSLIDQLYTSNNIYIVAVLVAVPCGTFSRAREKPIPLSLRRQGAPNPKPLRSTEHPYSLPNLAGPNAGRVSSANAIAKLGADVLRWGREHNIMTMIENPTRSILWELPDMINAMNGAMVRHDRLLQAQPSSLSSAAPPAPSTATKRNPSPPPSPSLAKRARAATAPGVLRSFLQPKASLTGPIVAVFKQHVLHRVTTEHELKQAKTFLEAKRLKHAARLGALYICQ